MDKVIQTAIDNLKNAYVPYSKFSVSSAIELKNGKIYKGINVENAAYGLTMCAERNALFSAYTDGVRKEDIKRLVVYTDHDYFVSPCGSCRQVMRELMEEDALVTFVNNQGDKKTVKNIELLPWGFSEKDL